MMHHLTCYLISNDFVNYTLRVIKYVACQVKNKLNRYITGNITYDTTTKSNNNKYIKRTNGMRPHNIPLLLCFHCFCICWYVQC